MDESIRSSIAVWLRRGVAALGVLYPATLLALIPALLYVGERWWVTGIILYLPRIFLGLPLPIIVGLLAVYRMRRLLALQVVSCLLWLGPLMGFVLPWTSGSDAHAPSVRVMSYNIDSLNAGEARVFEELDRFSPDIVALEEIGGGGEQRRLVELLTPRYRAVRSSGQFVVASRYPIVSTVDPERLPLNGVMRSPRFIELVLDTPLGKLALYVVHPISPREGFVKIRGAGVRREVLSGRLFVGLNAPTLRVNNALRRLQVQTFSRFALNEPYPVVIAGDTNLPGLSAWLHDYLSPFDDAFRAAGWGFGYTFPANRRRPWMRLDRILTSPSLQAVRFEVGKSKASDHHCVVADLQRRTP